jgi:hypothetical protein
MSIYFLIAEHVLLCCLSETVFAEEPASYHSVVHYLSRYLVNELCI